MESSRGDKQDHLSSIDLKKSSYADSNNRPSENENADTDHRPPSDRNEHPSNIHRHAVELNLTIQLARVLVAIQTQQYEKAQKLLKHAFSAAATDENETLDARCKFWEGVLYARLGQHLTACQCLLGAIRLIEIGAHEASIMIKYFLQHWEEICHLVDQSSDSDGKDAAFFKECLLKVLQCPGEHQVFDMSLSPSCYDDLLNSPLFRTLSRSRSPLFMDATTVHRHRNTDTSMPSTPASALPAPQTISSIIYDDMGTRSGSNSSGVCSVPSQIAYGQTESPNSSLFELLQKNILGQAAAIPAVTSSARSNLSNKVDKSLGQEDAVDTLMKKLMYEPSSRKAATTLQPGQSMDRDRRNITSPNRRFAQSLGSRSSSKANEMSRENNETSTRQNKTRSFGTLSSQSGGVYQPKTLAARRSRIPPKLNPVALKISSAADDSSRSQSAIRSPTAVEALVNAPSRPSPLRNDIHPGKEDSQFE